MKLDVMVHTFWDDYTGVAPQTYDTELPINGITVGACDGLSWIGDIDQAYQRINSVAALTRYYNSMANVNIKVRAGLLPRLAAPIEEAEFHAQALKITGSCLLDLEDGFIQGPLSNMAIYLERLRELCPTERIGCIAATPEHVAVVRPYVDSLWQAAYFGTGPDTVDTQNVEAVIAKLHIDFAALAPEKTVGIILWAGDNDPDRFLKSIRVVRAFGSELTLFRRLIWKPANIEIVRGWKTNEQSK